MAFTWRAINRKEKIEFKELNDLRYAADWLNDNAACPTNNGTVDSAPQYTGMDSAPQYLVNDATPQYTAEDSVPEFSANDATPQYVGMDSAPQYLTNDASPQYVGVDSAPQYTGRDNAPQNNTNNGTHDSSVTSDRRQKRDIVYL